MLNSYKELAVKNLTEHCSLLNPQPEFVNIDLSSEANTLMVDFTKVRATTASEAISVIDALELMRANRVRLLMIFNHYGEFSGVITAMDLMGRKPMLYANESGTRYADVRVKNIMLPKSKLCAVTRKEIEKSKVGDVAKTLNLLHQQYLLVVDDEGDEIQVCGLFAASDLKRTLGITLDIPFAHTFSDLERVINENKEVM
ncbi:MAG: CBS domain-containing protein [Proteobacteria bacterium]|nr:CBS domain-containing protein [Pseudomonadota bacterium]NOG60357.1 CBS domain-containing protein [Pseudomonadota bacterium]